MSGRGRKAVLPPAGHRADEPMSSNGLVVTVTNRAGFKQEYDFAELPVPAAMQGSLAVVFAAQARGWTSHGSAIACWRQVRVFAKFVSGLECPPDDLDGLTAAMLKRWRAAQIGTNDGKKALVTVRALLLRDPRLATGAVAEELAKRIPMPSPSKKSFTQTELERVLLAAQQQFRAARLRIQENTRLLEAWRAGLLPEGSREWKLGEVLDHLARTGDVPRTRRPGGQMGVTHRRILGASNAASTWGRLFLQRQELTALAVLLTHRFAWNLSVLDRMPTPSTAPAAGEGASVTYQVQIEKHRRGGGRWFSTENITDSGADSPGRLITQAIQATAHGRELAARLSPGTDLLMVARSQQVERWEHRNADRPKPVGPLVFGIAPSDANWWRRTHQLDGSPFRRLRQKAVTREGRPLQHSQGTHESVYVLPDPQVQQASREVFEAGALEALEQARTIVFEGKVADAADPAHQETATADCEDEDSSPWPSPTGGCGASYLLCLGCANAHVHPGHHPRLALLHQHLDGLRSAVDNRTWHRDWLDHFLRLEDLRDRIGPTAWNAALLRVNDNDRTLIQLLINGDLAP
ncbi:hypothetical protein OG725_37090 (plasmid) [Streptomyces sp. NBC_01213]|nr:hypothetical protein OG725_37090 [Streptomyces sp. NBC_01213]